MTSLVTVAGCGPRPHPRHPGISGLQEDWSEALRSRDPARLAALFRDQRIEQAPGLVLFPETRLGGRLVPLVWRPDPKSPLAPGILGQLEVLKSVTSVRVRAYGFHSFGSRRAVTALRIRLDGAVRGGYPRSDMGSVEVSLWRRAYHGPWYVADFNRVSMITLVGLGQSFVDRSADWRPRMATGRSQRQSACFGHATRKGGRLVAADDFDGDGHVDLACWDGTRLTVWRWGDSGFRLWGPSLFLPKTAGLGKLIWRLVDRDADGVPELWLSRGVWVEFSRGAPTWRRNGHVGADVRRDPRQTLPSSLRMQMGEEAKLVVEHASVDLDQDGRPEHILLLRETSRRARAGIALRFRLYWRLPSAAGSSTEGRWLDVTHVSGLPRRAWSFAAADFDGDGGLDLALATDAGVELYRNLFDRGQWARVRMIGPKGRAFSKAQMTVRDPKGRVLRRIRIGSPGLPLSRVLLGLGRLDHAKVSLRFPGGLVVKGNLEAGGNTLLSAVASGRRSGDRVMGLGPAFFSGASFRRWLGVPTGGKTVGDAGGDVVLLVCGGESARSCRALAAQARQFMSARGRRVRVILAWLGSPTPLVEGAGRWMETILDSRRASRFIEGPLLPRVLFYRAGKLRSVLVRPDPRRLTLEMAARFGSAAQ